LAHSPTNRLHFVIKAEKSLWPESRSRVTEVMTIKGCGGRGCRKLSGGWSCWVRPQTRGVQRMA